MDLSDTAAHHDVVVEHLEGITVVSVRRDLDEALLDDVAARLAGAADNVLVLDLAAHLRPESDLVGAVAGIITGSSTPERPLRAVVFAPAAREALRRAGVVLVHESLDEALGVVEGPLVGEGDRTDAGSAPAAGDVTVVTAHDLLGDEDQRA